MFISILVLSCLFYLPLSASFIVSEKVYWVKSKINYLGVYFDKWVWATCFFFYVHILVCWFNSVMLDFSHGVWLTSAACFLLLFTDRNRAGTGCLCQTALITLTLFKIHTYSHLLSTSPPSFMLYEPHLPITALKFFIMEIPPSLSSVTCSKQLFL